MAKFRIGDRVQVNLEATNFFAGKKFEVVDIIPHGVAIGNGEVNMSKEDVYRLRLGEGGTMWNFRESEIQYFPTTYTLICLNNEFDEIVSCQGYRKLDDAKEQMRKEYEAEYEDAKACGYDDEYEGGGLEGCIDDKSAYVSVGENGGYRWEIKETAIL